MAVGQTNPSASLHPGGQEITQTASIHEHPQHVTQQISNALVPASPSKLLVIGFMGGNVHAANTVHRESYVIGSLKERFPDTVEAQIYANRDGSAALKAVIAHLDRDRDGRLNAMEKASARIVIFGHSWGASQTVTLADELNRLGIPVLLTIQVDSVQKIAQNDGIIPPNVREAINFYQTEGLLRGRRVIAAADPTKTKIIGNYKSSYRENPVSVSGYPWYARAFMKQHIQIESDPLVWNQVEALIEARIH
jgi:pimeloyl-ACP methyl ester carboxylesterase